MAKSEQTEQKYPTPVVTVSTRKKNKGFKSEIKGIEVAPGLTLQDVPREMIQQHLRNTEHYWKTKFNKKHGGTHGGQQSFSAV